MDAVSHVPGAGDVHLGADLHMVGGDTVALLTQLECSILPYGALVVLPDDSVRFAVLAVHFEHAVAFVILGSTPGDVSVGIRERISIREQS